MSKVRAGEVGSVYLYMCLVADFYLFFIMFYVFFMTAHLSVLS